jgi:hypothetical protein
MALRHDVELPAGEEPPPESDLAQQRPARTSSRGRRLRTVTAGAADMVVDGDGREGAAVASLGKPRKAAIGRLSAQAGRRLGWGVADQAVSSLTNFAVTLYVARSLGAVQFFPPGDVLSRSARGRPRMSGWCPPSACSGRPPC